MFGERDRVKTAKTSHYVHRECKELLYEDEKVAVLTMYSSEMSHKNTSLKGIASILVRTL